MATSQQGHPSSAARLGLGDITSLIVGIIVGVGIFQTPSLVFQNVSGPWEAMGVWLLGGVLSLIGALTFAELASTYPRSGGEYVYLTRAYGSWVGFFFAWAQLAVIRTGGGIAALAYVFGVYASQLWDLGPIAPALYAVGIIVLLTAINILGVNPSRRTQNLLTIAKVVGLGGIVLVGFFWSSPRTGTVVPPVSTAGSFALALLYVLYTYDGWNEATYVVGEVRNWRRNVPLALILGTLAVTVIYCLVNLAYLAGLGFAGAQASATIPADLLAQSLGRRGSQAMSVLVMISVLGAVHGTIFSGSRIYAELGADHRIFAPLSRWHPQLRTPVWSLAAQGLISIFMVLLVGLSGQGQNGFDVLLKYTSAVFWLFFLLTGLSVFVLRWKDRGIDRPFRVPLYPWVPSLFCGCCGFLLCGSLVYAWKQSLLGLAILLVGIPFYLVSRQTKPLPHPPLNGPVSLRRPAGRSSAAEVRKPTAEPLP